MRALAVLAVIGYHVEPRWFPGGFLGVDTFFVLSGFLITSLLLAEWRRDEGIGLRAFWARRARRLLPALLLVLAAVSLAAWAWTPSIMLGRLRGDGLAGLFYSANWRLIASGQSYFDLFATPSPLRHLWSLAIEEQFYVVWPVLTLLLLRAGRGSRRVLAGACGVGIVASVALMASLYERADPSRAYYGTDTRAYALLVGALLAIGLERYPLRNAVVWRATGAAALFGCAVAWLAVRDTSPWLYHGGLFAYAAVAAVVIAASTVAGRSPLRLRPLQTVGRMSYGLYLWHWPVIVYATAARTGVDGLALACVRVGLTFALAALSYRFVEQPIRHGALRGRLAIGVAPVSVLATGMALLAGTAAAVPLPAYYRIGTVVAPPPAIAAPAPAIAPTSTSTSSSLGEPAVTAPTTVASAPQRVLLVGDSVAYTLQDGLQPALAARGVAFSSAAIIGCGAVDAVVADDNGNPYPWAESCRETLARAQADALATFEPDLVVWLSTWETSARIVDGVAVKLGTPAGDDAVMTTTQAAVDRLTAGGARLVFLVPAPTVAGDQQPDVVASADEFRGLAAIYRAIASREPSTVSVLDLTPIVCGDATPCPESTDGLRLRPIDGRHFTPETAPVVAGPIVGALLDVRWPAPDPGTRWRVGRG